MSYSLTQVNAAADTFQVWLNLTNQMANLISTEVVTANTNANGAVTTGNVYVNGIFAALTVAIPTALRGGNVQSSAALAITSNVNVSGDYVFVGNSTVNAIVNSSTFSLANSTATFVLQKPSAAAIAADTYYLNANGSWVQLGVEEQAQVNTSGTSAQLIDSFIMASYYSADYSLVINDNGANNRQMVKVAVLHDEGTAYHNEYSVITSNSELGAFTANANTTHARLYLTPTVADTTVTFKRETITK